MFEHYEADADRIRHDIHSLRMQAHEVQELAEHRIRLQAPGGAHVQATTAPALVNLTALDLLEQIRTMGRVLAQTAGLHLAPAMSAHDLLAGLDRDEYCDRLAQRDDAWQIVRLIAQASESCEHLLDPDPTLKVVGTCPTCHAAVWIPESDRVEGRRYCESCGSAMDLAQVLHAQWLRFLLSGMVDTAAGISKLLRGCGIEVKNTTIAQWAKRGKLRKRGVDERGYPVYLVGEVMRLSGHVAPPGV